MVKKAEADEPTPTTPSGAGKKTAAGPRVGGLFRHVLVTLIGVITALGVGLGVINHYVLEAGTDEQGSRLANIYTQQYAGFFNQVFSQTSRQIGSITADPALAELLAGGDEAAIQQRAAVIAASLAYDAQVFLVGGQSAPGNMNLGFAAQDMFERAQRGESTSAEVIPVPERPLLLLAATVRDANRAIVGAMLVAFDLKAIAGGLKGISADNGYMALEQRLDGEASGKTVMSHGGEFANARYSASAPTLYPNLIVNFSLRPDAAPASSRGMFLLLGAGTTLLVVIAVLLSTLLLKRTLQNNVSMLLQYAENLIQRTPPPAGIVFTLDLFADAAASLKRTARGNANGDTPAAAARAPQRTPRDEDALDVDAGQSRPAPAAASSSQVAAEIFRAYDIRGVVGKTLTEESVKLIGKAIGSEVLDSRQSAIFVGRDGRLSGPQLFQALVEGITSTGCNVIDIGVVPTPLVYFAAANSSTKSGVMLTGSHNPPEYNGLKIVINGETLSEDRIQALRQRILEGNFRAGSGSAETQDVSGKYKERIKDDIVLARSLKIVVDCGNGVAGAVAPQLLESLGCAVIPLYCDVDGHFPNHHPDPSKPDNLADLIARVTAEQADLGLAFDGDGDRIGIVTPQGQIIWPDRLMMLYARDILLRTPGADIIFDVKCTRDLPAIISQHGGRPIMWRTGHSLIKAKLKETGAALAGEMSGHIFFNDRWPGFDDAIYAAARLLEILSLEVGSADEVFAEFPSNVSTPELHIDVTEDSKFRIIQALQKNAQFPGGSISTIDGVRVDFPNAWGLVRASNTTPVLVARFEGRTEADLETVRATFREQLLKVEPGLTIDF